MRTLPRVGPAVLAAALLGAASVTAGVALTATSGWLIVRADERPVILTLLTAIVAVRAFGMARPVLRYAERLRSHDSALRDLAGQRAETYARLVPLTPARLGRRRRTDLLSGVVDDLTDVVEAQVRVTVPVVSAALAGVLTAVLTALLAPTVGLVLVAVLAATAIVFVVAGRLERPSQSAVLEARAEVARVSELVVGQSRELRAVGGMRAAMGWLEDAHDVLRARSRTQSRGRALTSAGLLLIIGGGTIAAALAVRELDVSAPVRGLLVLTPVALGEALLPLVDAVRALARAEGAAVRLSGLLDQSPAVADRANHAPTGASGTHAREDDAGEGRNPTPRIQLRGITAVWDAPTADTARGNPDVPPGDRDVPPGNPDISSGTSALPRLELDLGPVDLDLAPGSRTLITGPNGGGKSTLLAVLARHLDPTSGRYLVAGIEVRDLPLAEVRELVAVVDDEPHLFATTVRENLRLALPRRDRSPLATSESLATGTTTISDASEAPSVTSEILVAGAATTSDASKAPTAERRGDPQDIARAPDAEEALLVDGLVRAGLGPWLAGLPDRLDTRIGTGGRGVSGGERARLSVARAIVSQRPVILLDEPVAHLDDVTAGEVLDDLLSGTTGQTVVLVSHQRVAVERFDQVVEIGAQGMPGRPVPTSAAPAGPVGW